MLAMEAGDDVDGCLLPEAQEEAETGGARQWLDRASQDLESLFGIDMYLSVIILFTCWGHVAINNIWTAGSRTMFKTFFILLLSVVCSVIIVRLSMSKVLKRMMQEQLEVDNRMQISQKIDFSYIAKLRSLSAYIISICLVLYNVRIIAQISQGIWFPEMSFRKFPWGIARSVGNLSAVVIFCHLLLLGLLTPYWVSSQAIRKIIRTIEEEDKPDWFALTVKVHMLDCKLEKLWSAREAGGALLACFGFSAVGIVAFAYEMLFFVLHKWHFVVLACALATCLGVAVMCAQISSLCQNNSSNSESLEGAARRYPARRNKYKEMKPDDKREYLAFLEYVRTNQMGAELIGVHITTQLVISLATRAAVGIPTIYAVMARLAQSTTKDN